MFISSDSTDVIIKTRTIAIWIVYVHAYFGLGVDNYWKQELLGPMPVNTSWCFKIFWFDFYWIFSLIYICMYIFNLNHLTFIESNYDLKHYFKKKYWTISSTLLFCAWMWLHLNEKCIYYKRCCHPSVMIGDTLWGWKLKVGEIEQNKNRKSRKFRFRNK